jgi:hypothetical protein
MSNHLAVATVTASLGRRAHAAAAGALDADVDLSFGRPVAPSGENSKPTLHVYLYQVTPNAALRNADLPSRDSIGRRVARPRASIDLHYLLTFYGDATTLMPERMLAAVVRDLHANAVLEPGFIQMVTGGADHTELEQSNLDSAPERVKFTPAQLTLEELSRLWSIMVQSPYALSVAYLASVVEIEALESGTAALPVLKRGQDDRGVETELGSFPRLDSWWAGAPASAARRPRLPSLPSPRLGDRLALTGATFGGDVVTVRFTHARLSTATALVIPLVDRSAEEVIVALPNDAPAQDAWAAGLYAVTVEVDRGGELRESNVLPLAMAPRITDIQPNPAARTAGDATLTITCAPKVLPGQTVTLLIADREVAANAIGAPADTVVFDIVDATPLTNELIRIRVDGVPSLPFLFDSATGGFAFDPTQRVTIT